MKNGVRLAWQLLVMPLPWALRRRLLNWLPGFDLAQGSRIGISVLQAAQVRLRAGARIGHLNVFKGLDSLDMGPHASIGRGNWVSGYPRALGRHFLHVPQRQACLVMHEHSAMTNRHIIDCTDCITIGAFATFGGFRSQVLTHSIDVATGRQHCAPISLGAYSFVGTGVVVLGGARLPDYSVLGAGSVLSRAFDEPYTLYAGNPAQARKSLSADAAYFTRTTGFVV